MTSREKACSIAKLKLLKDIPKEDKERKKNGLVVHSLRHTFGTRLLQKGVDIITVRELMRHSSVKVTERYVHTLPVHKHDAVQRLVEGVNGVSTKGSELTPKKEAVRMPTQD